jgi:hypothetical protein
MNAPYSAAISLELLESRLAPAGTLLISTAGGILTITGDAANNAIAITDMPDTQGPGTPGTGAWEISDPIGSGTTFILNGVNMGMGAFQISAQNGIIASLGDSDDRLDIVPSGAPSGMFISGAITIDGGKGNDTVNLGTGAAQQLSAGGTVTIKLGDGIDELNFAASALFKGAVSVQGGAGSDNIILTGGAAHVFQKGLSVDLGTGADMFRILSDSFEVLGSTTIKGAGQAGMTQVIDILPTFGTIDGNFAVTILAGNLDGRVNTLASEVFRVGGALSVTGGAGDDSFEFAGTVTVSGALTVDLKGGANGISLGAGRALQAGSLTIRGGAGSDTVLLDDNSTLLVAGAMKLDLGAGTNLFDIDAGHNLTAGALTFTGGLGADMVTFDGASLTVLGNTSFALGAGGNTVLLEPTTSAFIGGSLAITGGAGSDSITINSPLFRVLGNFTQALGDGVNTSAIAGSLFHVSGNTAYTGGSGDDSFQFSGGNVIINRALLFTGGNATVVNVLDLQVGEGTVGSVTLKGGASADEIYLGNINGVGTSRLTILGSVNANFGAGNAGVVITDTVLHGPLLLATATVSGQFDSVAINQSTLNGTTVIGMAAGMSSLEVNDSFIRGNFTVNTGAGADTVLLDTSAGTAAPNTWLGVVRVNTGAGIDTIAIGSPLLLPNAANLFYKNVFIDGGADADGYTEGNSTLFAGSVITQSNIP